MTSQDRGTSRRFPPQLLIALLASLPGTYLGAATYLGLPHPELAPPLAALVYGIAIIGAAFVLSWAAEAAQVDISAGLALAVLALLAVLPLRTAGSKRVKLYVTPGRVCAVAVRLPV